MIVLDDCTRFSYVSCGHFQTTAKWLHPRRVIDSYEIILVLAGQVNLQANGTDYQLASGDVLLLHPDQTHFGSRPSFGKTAFYWMHFYAAPSFPLHLSDFFHTADSSRLNNLFKQLLHVAHTPGYSAAAKDLSAASVVSELAYLQTMQPESRSALAGELFEWVRIHIHRNITVKEVAVHFGYNEDYLGKLFRKSYHMGLKEYINAEKISAAKNYLLTTSLTVKQVAALLGYQDEKLFIKFFQYHEAISPARFRNAFCNTHLNQE